MKSPLQETVDLETLRLLEKKVLWLASYMIHHANHIRPSRDSLKVGGHQASSASCATILTALYFQSMRPEDRIAVKPHASPIMHAIMYLMGRQELDKLKKFRGFGGVQSYPSITKDTTDIDYSTGSVGMGVAATLFDTIVQDYISDHGWRDSESPGRMIALVGDAEFDEGNIFEALLEGWKHHARNLWWVIDYNRQSLDGVVDDALFERISRVFDSLGWKVSALKYGKKLMAARNGPAGEAIVDWIDRCPNQLYSALTYQGGADWRSHLELDLAGTSGLKEFLDSHDDTALAEVMTNLGGHDLESLTEAFDEAGNNEQPQCFIAYTVKGQGLPLAGHKDNHAGMMSPTQMEQFQKQQGVPVGAEWDRFAGMEKEKDRLVHFIDNCAYQKRKKSSKKSGSLVVPSITAPVGDKYSTQEAFGKIMFELGKEKGEFADRIVTTSPDVTSSTNLGPWVNRRKLYAREDMADVFKDKHIPSTQIWQKGPHGQHIELGIAENNLFSLLGQLGLSARNFGQRLIPVGTLYDPFINRGLDALNYATYQDSRFIIVGTPAGISLGPEGGAHQSIGTPLVGLTQPNLTSVEPAYGDELAVLMEWAFDYLQQDDGSSVYFRLSSRKIEQLPRTLSEGDRADLVKGGYWLRRPTPATTRAIVYAGAIAPEVMRAVQELLADNRDIAVLAITSSDRLYRDWSEARRRGALEKKPGTSHVDGLLSQLARDVEIVTVCDAHPLNLSWIGCIRGNPVVPLGVEGFGQCGDLPDLYEYFRLDSAAIVAAHGRLER
ncbi:1-deoxy-D-xylulose-5-phosphate synthase N-terminal domain-containing protein [Emcibacter sp.]|uniref:1-deoxy-D-xylulose-5-phosphate synthase N-terminal domain-containing protein n=1 Tax=Emcibacter sp. TaxID=1979954 RepID=UPI003A8F0692